MKRSNRLSFGSNEGSRPMGPKKMKQDLASRALLMEEERQQNQHNEDNTEEQNDHHPQAEHRSLPVHLKQNLSQNDANDETHDDYGGLGLGVGVGVGEPPATTGGNAQEDEDDDQMPSLEVEQARLLQQMAIDMGRQTETADFYKNDAEERHITTQMDKVNEAGGLSSAPPGGENSNVSYREKDTTQQIHSRNGDSHSFVGNFKNKDLMQHADGTEHNIGMTQGQHDISNFNKEENEQKGRESHRNIEQNEPRQDEKVSSKKETNRSNSKPNRNKRQNKLDDLHQNKLQDLIEKGNKLSEEASRMSGIGPLMAQNLYGFQNKSHLHNHEELSMQMRRQENQLMQQQQLRQKQLALQQQQQQLQQHLQQKEREQKLRLLKEQIRQQEELYMKQQEQYRNLVGGTVSDDLPSGVSKDTDISSMEEQRLRLRNLHSGERSKSATETLMRGNRPSSNFKDGDDEVNDVKGADNSHSFRGIHSSRSRNSRDTNDQFGTNRHYEQIMEYLVNGSNTVHGSQLSGLRLDKWTELFFDRPNANDHNSTETWLLQVMDVSDPLFPVPANSPPSSEEQQHEFGSIDPMHSVERSENGSNARKRKGEPLKRNQTKQKPFHNNGMRNLAHMNGLHGMGGGFANENSLMNDYLREEGGHSGMNNSLMNSVLGQGFESGNGGMPMNRRKDMMHNDNLNLLMNMNRNAMESASDGMYNLGSSFNADNVMMMNGGLSGTDAAAMMNMNMGLNMNRGAEAMMKQNNENGFNTEALMGRSNGLSMEDMMRMNNGWNGFDRGNAAGNMLKMNGFGSGGMNANFGPFGLNK